jgi:hypothetical protein
MRELVTVGYFDDEIKAQLARLALEEAGIRVWAGSAPQPNWDGGVKLQVEREDEQAARKVLTDRSPVEYPDESEEVFDSLDGRGETAELKESRARMPKQGTGVATRRRCPCTLDVAARLADSARRREVECVPRWRILKLRVSKR